MTFSLRIGVARLAGVPGDYRSRLGACGHQTGLQPQALAGTQFPQAPVCGWGAAERLGALGALGAVLTACGDGSPTAGLKKESAFCASRQEEHNRKKLLIS